MMNRRYFLTMTALALVTGGPGLAKSPEQEIVRQLHKQGYSRITVSRTFLGRTRIMAIDPNSRREIIVNPRTGEILRDFSKPFKSGTPSEDGLLDASTESEDGEDTGGDDNGDDSGDDSGDDHGGDDSGGDDSGGDDSGGDDSGGGDSSGSGSGDD